MRDRATGELVIMKLIYVEGVEELKQMIENLQTQKNINSENILLLIDYQLK